MMQIIDPIRILLCIKVSPELGCMKKEGILNTIMMLVIFTNGHFINLWCTEREMCNKL